MLVNKTSKELYSDKFLWVLLQDNKPNVNFILFHTKLHSIKVKYRWQLWMIKFESESKTWIKNQFLLYITLKTKGEK